MKGILADDVFASMPTSSVTTTQTHAPRLTPAPVSVSPRSTPRGWYVMAIGAFAVAGYALSFYVRGRHAFPPPLREGLSPRPWGIYSHVLFGSVALLTGPFQFRRGILRRRRSLHRRLGVAYVAAAALTGAVGLYMAPYSFGGLNTHLGFGILGAFTLVTTMVAYRRIRAFDVVSHRQWMIRSFALIFAAVTLRLELPLLIVSLQDFAPAYAIVAWLCWIPNLLIAEWYIRRSRHGPASHVPTHSRARG